MSLERRSYVYFARLEKTIGIERVSEMHEFSNPVAVIGNGLTALGITRAFGRNNIDVFAVSDRRDPVVFSKYCRRSFTTYGNRFDRRVLRRLLRKIGKGLSRRAVVYPTSDLDAVNLAELKDELPDDFYFVVGKKDAVKTLVDKKRFYKLLSDSEIVHPQTYFPEDCGDVCVLGTQLEFPIFIRPAITQLFTQVFPQSGKGFIARTPAELLSLYRLATQRGIDVMFQEIIPGPPINSYQLEGYYNAEYDPLVLFARQRLRIWPGDFGNTTLCRSIPMAGLMKEKNSINQFLATLGYNGLMSAEFKKDERDKSLRLLEINARPWWHFWLSEGCGVDIIFTSYLDVIGKTSFSTHRERYESDFKSIHLYADLMSSASMLWNRSLSFREWVTSLRGVRQFAFFSSDDLSPFIVALAKAGSQLFKSTLSKKNS